MQALEARPRTIQCSEAGSKNCVVGEFEPSDESSIRHLEKLLSGR